MKKSILSWFILLVCCISFIILMSEVCNTLENTGEALNVIISATAIFIPNVGAIIVTLVKK